MKKIFIYTFLFLIIPTVTFGSTQSSSDDYNEYKNTFDLSVFEEELDSDTYELLNELGVADFDFDSILSVSIDDILKIIKNIVMGKIKTPLQSCLIVLSFVILSSMIQSFKHIGSDSVNELYSTATALLISSAVLVNMGSTISLSAMSVKVASDFVYAFLPVFCGIVAMSGGITTSFSTNSFLLILSQGLSFLASNIMLPAINCFLALGVCSSIRYELHLDRLISNIKKIITTGISVISALFVSILSIKTAVASQADAIGLRSLRFAINSVVPVIGSAISEGLLSIQTYSSLIKSSVGVVGIIAVALVFLPAITEVVLWRICLSFCGIVSDVFDDKTVSQTLSTFKDAMLLLNVVLILSMVTTVISIGILVSAGNV